MGKASSSRENEALGCDVYQNAIYYAQFTWDKNDSIRCKTRMLTAVFATVVPLSRMSASHRCSPPSAARKTDEGRLMSRVQLAGHKAIGEDMRHNPGKYVRQQSHAAFSFGLLRVSAQRLQKMAAPINTNNAAFSATFDIKEFLHATFRTVFTTYISQSGMKPEEVQIV